MNRLSVFASRLRALLQRRKRDRELDEEIRFHLEMQMEANVRAGMDPAEARYAARRSFGAVGPVKERYREQSSFALAEAAVQDIRYAARTLRKSPAFALTSVAVLALAIGANTAMFCVLRAVLFRPLPYESPEQLVMLWKEISSQNVREGRSAYQDVEQWRRRSGVFAGMAIFDPVSLTLNAPAGAEQISAARISPNFFPLLGIQPVVGRNLTESEALDRQRVVLISHRFWVSRFGRSSGAIGAKIQIDGATAQIIGVLPEGFQFTQLSADVWEPHTVGADWEARRTERGSGPWFVVGRLRPLVTLEQAQEEMSAIARRLDEELPPGDRRRGISVVPLRSQVTGPRMRLALWMLAGVLVCVLLIAASNAAGLSLARSVARAREFAVRAALGAGQARIVRQLLAESLTLALAAGALGMPVALAFIRLALAIQPENAVRIDEAVLDAFALAWAVGLCLFTGVLAGLAPAVAVARRHSKPEGGRGIAGGAAASRIRRALVVTEFALSIVLLISAGLLVRSLWSIGRVDPGFRPGGVLSLQLSIPAYKTVAERAGFFQQVLEQVESLPGVESAGVIGDFFIGGNPERILTAEGDNGTVSANIRYRSDEVSPGCFRTLGTPLIAGRFFSAEDGAGSPPVAIVNSAMARRLWPGAGAVGMRFKAGAEDSARPWTTVVGVVGDMRRQGPEKEPVPQIFEPLAQNPSRLATLLVRGTADDPLRVASAVQAAVRRVDRQAPLYGVTTLEARVGAYLAERRFYTSLLIGFSAITLMMAAAGIYGLIQYSVSARTHEIGIRMAVGARSGAIFGMIMRDGLKLSLAGLAPGLAGALCLGRFGSSLLSGVTAGDPPTIVTVCLLLMAVSAAACYFPARRAVRIEPLAALRQE